MKFLGALADRILQGLIPASVARQQLMFTNTWLADVEADHDNWEPDELWFAQHKTSAGTPPAGGTAPTEDSPVLRLVQPAAADSGRPFGGGRHSKTDHRTDQQVIDELVEDFRQFITDCFDKRFRK